MRLTFTGTLGLNDLSSKNPYIREGKTNDKAWQRFGCSIASAKNNRAYLEIFGNERDSIKTMDVDGNKIEISWSDRFDSDVVKNVAYFRKHTVVINDERNEFISDYDFVEFLKNHADEIKDKKFTVTGQSQANVYKGVVSQRFQIQNIYEAKADDASQLRLSTEYYFNKDSIDTADWKTEKAVNINGYIKTYISEEKKDMYVPLSIVFDCSKIDFENEKHVAIVKTKLKLIGCDLVDGNIKCKLKNNTYYSMAVVLSYVNGSEKVEFTEDMLTATQKECIELGINKLEDFRPAGAVYGERVTSYKLVGFDLNTVAKTDYSNGYVDMETSCEDFEEQIYVPVKEEKIDDVLENSKPKETSADSDDDSDLFD